MTYHAYFLFILGCSRQDFNLCTRFCHGGGALITTGNNPTASSATNLFRGCSEMCTKTGTNALVGDG